VGRLYETREQWQGCHSCSAEHEVASINHGVYISSMNFGYFLSILQRQGEVTRLKAPVAPERPLPTGDSKNWNADYDKWKASATRISKFAKFASGAPG
jgi:hypothetical protein